MPRILILYCKTLTWGGQTTLTTHRYAAQPVQSSTSTIDYREISNTYVNDTQSIGADHSTPDRETGRCDTYTQTPKARRRASLIHFLSFRPDDAPSRTNRGDDLAGAARILHSDAKLRYISFHFFLHQLRWRTHHCADGNNGGSMLERMYLLRPVWIFRASR